jgi:hypothetical protein
MEAFYYLMYPVIVVGSIALRAYWIATGAEFWPSVGWESLQLLLFTCLWLSGAKHFRKDPPEKDQSQPPTTSSTP